MIVRRAYEILRDFPERSVSTRTEKGEFFNLFLRLANVSDDDVRILSQYDLVKTISAEELRNKFDIHSESDWQRMNAEKDQILETLDELHEQIRQKESAFSISRFIFWRRYNKELQILKLQRDSTLKQSAPLRSNVGILNDYRMINEECFACLSYRGSELRKRIKSIDSHEQRNRLIFEADLGEVIEVLVRKSNTDIEWLSYLAEKLEQPINKELILTYKELTTSDIEWLSRLAEKFDQPINKGSILTYKELTTQVSKIIAQLEHRCNHWTKADTNTDLQEGWTKAISQACLVKRNYGGFDLDYVWTQEKNKDDRRCFVAVVQIITGYRPLTTEEEEQERWMEFGYIGSTGSYGRKTSEPTIEARFLFVEITPPKQHSLVESLKM